MVLGQILQTYLLIVEELGFLTLFGPAFKFNKPKGNANYFLAIKNMMYWSAIYEQLESTQMSSSLNLLLFFSHQSNSLSAAS